MDAQKRVKQHSKEDGWHGTHTVQPADSSGQRFKDRSPKLFSQKALMILHNDILRFRR